MGSRSNCAGLGALALLMFASSGVHAAASAEEAAQVGLTGTPLTPIGAIRAGNAEGTIPAWEGGITTPPAGYKDGGWYVDPYAQDQPLLTITAQNYQQHAEKLMPGTIALLKKFPDSVKVNVYPTHRSASYAQWFYENSVSNAANTRFCAQAPSGPNSAERCLDTASFKPGVAFPIPKTGGEAMWNHTFWFFGKHHIWTGYAFNAFADGSYAETTTMDRSIYPYYMTAEERPAGAMFERNGGGGWCFSQENLAPPRTAGSIFGGCNYVQTVDFDAYLYVPGQRRVRKAPEIGFYDSPGTGSDGLRTADSRFMFAMTGNEEWYEWSKPVRKEMYIPYNSYKIASPEYDFKDIVRPGHLNTDLIRYELHRVWVVEGKLKPGFRHLGPHRFVYIDEDSWAAAGAEMYDAKGQLWRVSEAYLLNFYNVPMTSYWGDNNIDMLNGRQSSVNAWFNVGAKRGTLPPDFKNMPDPSIMTPAGLRKYGVR